MPPLPEPKKCCVPISAEQRCGKPAMYKVGHRGYCEEHKPGGKIVQAQESRWRNAPIPD